MFVVQSCTTAYSLDGTLDKLEHYTHLAKYNSQLVVFPEALYVAPPNFFHNADLKNSIGGYPKLLPFGVTVGYHSQVGREEYICYHNAAIEITSPVITRIENISKELGVFLVVDSSGS